MTTHAFDADQSNFETLVLAASHTVPVVVDFWAPWCGPCKTLKPILEKLAEEYDGRFLLARVNSDEAPDLAAAFQVRSIPSVKAFVDGRIVDEFVGVLPEPSLRQFLDRLQPSPSELQRREAMSLASQDRVTDAINLLRPLLAEDPKNEAARLDLIELLIGSGQYDEATTLLDHVFVDAVDRAQAARATLSLASAGGDIAALRRAAEEDHQDPGARIALGRALAAQGDYRSAMDELLSAVRIDRAFDDQLARRTMLQLFDLLSTEPAHEELVREYRRALASALN